MSQLIKTKRTNSSGDPLALSYGEFALAFTGGRIKLFAGNSLGDAGELTVASNIKNTPAGNISSTTVQAALNELDTEKAAAGANTDITSILLNQTGLVVKGASANALTIKPNETLSADRTLNLKVNDADRTFDLSGNLVLGGNFTLASGKTATISNSLTLAGTDGSTLNVGAGGTLGSAAFVNTGASGATIPLLNGNNTYSGTSTFSKLVTFQDPTTNSKQFQLDLSGISAATTRVVKVQNTVGGTMIVHNGTQAFTTNQNFNNGFSSFGAGAVFQTGGLSYGEWDDSTTTGSNVEVDNLANDYPLRVFTNSSLSSIKGIKGGNSYFNQYINNTGATTTFKNNQSVGALVSKIITPTGADVVIPDVGKIAFHFNVNTQNYDMIYCTDISGMTWSQAVNYDIGVASGKVFKVNNTQVVGAQQAAVADATNSTDVITQLNALLSRLRTHGLIAT